MYCITEVVEACVQDVQLHSQFFQIIGIDNLENINLNLLFKRPNKKPSTVLYVSHESIKSVCRIESSDIYLMKSLIY